MTINSAKRSPAEINRDRTTWVRDIRTNEKICAYEGRRAAEAEVADFFGTTPDYVESGVLDDGPLECTEVFIVHGDIRAWIDEPPHSLTSDEVYESIYLMQDVAQ